MYASGIACNDNILGRFILHGEKKTAKPQNTRPHIYISLNHKSVFCVILRSSKDFYTCKTGGLMSEALHSVILLHPMLFSVFFTFVCRLSLILRKSDMVYRHVSLYQQLLDYIVWVRTLQENMILSNNEDIYCGTTRGGIQGVGSPS